MQLILTGGGDSSHFHKIDSHFIKLLKNNPSLLFIPLAGKRKNWKNGLERISETFSTIHFKNIDMCINLAELTWSQLKKYDAVYFDGGNTFQLLSKIRHTHMFELLQRFLHHGGVINGDSAGAVVLGSHIETAHFGHSGDENLAGVISYQGLNLLGNWGIHCHYQRSENREIKKFVKEYGIPILALHEETAVSIKGKWLKVIGERSASLFDTSKVTIVKVGQRYKFP